MEVDTAHSLIEKAMKKAKSIYTPTQFREAIEKARKDAFVVEELGYRDFFDVKMEHSECPKIQWKNKNGEIMKTSTVKFFSVDKNGLFKYCCSWADQEIEEILLDPKAITQMKKMIFKPAYKSPIEIKEEKYKALNLLCKKKLIPTVHHDFNANLNVNVKRTKK